MHELTVIIVSWNVRDLLRACLRSVLEDCTAAGLPAGGNAEPSGQRAEIVVVDNNSGDGSAEMVAAEFPGVRLIANRANLGFGAANNQGLAASDGRAVLFLNPDTVVRPGALSALLAFLATRPDIGAVGPRLLNPDGTTQSSRRRFPRLSTAFVESSPLQRYLGNLPSLRSFYVQEAPDDQAQEVDWLVGAALMIRRSVLDEVGGFDERFFMYSEEMDLCFRIRQAGYGVWYTPEAEIVHHEAASSSQNLFRQNVNFHESRYRFFRKHSGAAGALALRWFTFATYLFRLAEESGKLLLQPSKRDMRRGRIKLYARVVQWYLSGS